MVKVYKAIPCRPLTIFFFFIHRGGLRANEKDSMKVSTIPVDGTEPDSISVVDSMNYVLPSTSYDTKSLSSVFTQGTQSFTGSMFDLSNLHVKSKGHEVNTMSKETIGNVHSNVYGYDNLSYISDNQSYKI